MEKLELHIEGMHCGSCAVGIQMLTSQMDGVSKDLAQEAMKRAAYKLPLKTKFISKE